MNRKLVAMDYRLQTPKECGDRDYITATARRYFKMAWKYAKEHNVTCVRVNRTVFEFIIDAHEQTVMIYLENQLAINPRRWHHKLIPVAE